MKTTRRSVLKAGAGALAFGALAGCIGNDSGGEETPDGYTAFFSLYDWANQVAGDELTFENPVGTGRMGHGWSPDGDITRDIASSDMFIYLDTPEFSWAQDIVQTLEQDHDDVLIIEALDGLEPHFIPFDGGESELPEPDYGHDFDEDSLGFDDFEIWDLRTDEQLGYWHVEHWHGGVPDVPLDSFVPVGIVIRDTDERVLPLGRGETYSVDARVADGAPEDVVDIESQGDHVEFHGRSLGNTEVVFEIYREDELVYETSDEPEGVEVVEDADEDGFFDPHLWVDPIHAQRMVENIAAELAEYDPDNEETYRENAATYNERLDDVDRQFRELRDSAELDVAVFAGHDSYQYVERRYNFDLVTPVGVTPDAVEDLDSIANMIEIIEANDIDTVLYDPFEAPDPDDSYPQMVEMIFENTDVDDAEPLSPVEGLTQEWADNDYGWVEQMEEINIPSLEKALKA